jgi:superfamily II DNA or RNA helicase
MFTDSVIINCNSWNDFQTKLLSLNKKEKGDAFELLTKLYFKITPVFSFYDEVWMLSEVPQKTLEYLKIPSHDLGIDLIAKNGDEYHAIQCKFHADIDSSVSFREVATFISLLEGNKNFTQGYICSSANITSRNFEKIETKPITTILVDTWQKLDKDFFDKARNFLNKEKYAPIAYKPKEHQIKAIKQALKHFVKENNTRGKLIFPCGSGKSLTGYWMTQELKSQSTIIAVPSLSLVKQTLDVYLREIVAKGIKVKWLCICSDEGIGSEEDIVFKTENLGVPCQTDPVYIKKWLLENKDENIVIFTTYQSGRIIAEVSRDLKFKFDVGIFDEAHKTVGSDKKLFSHLLFEENIAIDKRIFMTATERFYAGSKDDIISMDDEDIYGDTFAQMSFKEAIEMELLTDYKVITIEVKQSEIADFIKDNNLVQLNDNWKKETEARSLASMLALRKAMMLYPIKNAVSFHSSINKAVRNKELQSYITDTYKYAPIDTYTVSGKMPTTKRNIIVKEFADSQRALITNARCLTEGVDVPNIDCIVFADPRKSKVDIVQALGRALRKKEGKEWGYVILPVVYDDVTQEIDNENFNEILAIVRGLASNDDRIIEYFKDKKEVGSSTKKENTDQFQFEVFSDYVDANQLSEQLQIKLWDKLSQFNWLPFEEAREIVRGLGLINIEQYRKYCSSGKKPSNIPSEPNIKYKTSGWISWGDWTGSGNIAPQHYNWINFEDAREIARSYKMNSWEDWLQIENLPLGIPKYPNTVYKTKFNGIKDWLGIDDFQYLSFHEARNKVRSMGINKLVEWREIVKTPLFPSNIPRYPENYYKNKGWVNWGVWLGTAREESNFLEKREEVHKLNLKSREEYYKYIHSENLKTFFPENPRIYYTNKGWKGWVDWLGLNTQKKKEVKHYLQFEIAREIIQNLKLTSQKDWENYIKSNDRNPEIPKFPHKTYRQFISFKDWIGVDSVNKWKSYTDGKKFVSKLGIMNVLEWIKYAKSNERPSEIPSTPQRIYKYNGWISWEDWLGNQKISFAKVIWLDFESARKIVHNKNLLNEKEWLDWSKSDEFPNNIPRSPRSKYKNSGWKGMNDWLGCQKNIFGSYLPFNDARTYVRSLELKNVKEWNRFTKSQKKPIDIPASPQKVYNNNGWLNWTDWLGKTPGWSGEYLDYESAKNYTRKFLLNSMKDWRNHTKKPTFPYDIPKSPHIYYKNKGWKGWADFLGKVK